MEQYKVSSIQKENQVKKPSQDIGYNLVNTFTAVFLMATFIFILGSFNDNNRLQAKPTGPHYEYKMVGKNPFSTDWNITEVNKLAKQGWRVVDSPGADRATWVLEKEIR